MRAITAAACVGLFATCVASARDLGQYAGVDAETRAWFSSLRNQKGEVCCDVADGHQIEDPSWRITGEGYAVKIDALGWRPISPDSVVAGTNRMGYAIVWIWPVNSLTIRCFMPGTTG